MPQIILASQSAYRKNLLQRLGIHFIDVPPTLDEEELKSTFYHLEAHHLAEKLALEKAKSVQDEYPEELIIASDQLAYWNGTILGKPGTPEKAFEQLKNMRGAEHQLITSLCVLYGEKSHIHTDISTLKMRLLSDKDLHKYIEMDEPLDCAASYKLEKAGVALFESIESKDFSAIEGLPLLNLCHILFTWKIPFSFYQLS